MLSLFCFQRRYHERPFIPATEFCRHPDQLCRAGGVAAASYTLGQPWAIVAATTLTAGLMVAGLKANKHVLENELKEHPKSHRYSTSLGRIAEELYKASGLDAEKYSIYDFQINPNAPKKKGPLTGLIRDMMQNAQGIPNAAALHLGKPVIMISSPLLELLDYAEEKAVLAHEFAHAAARHQHVHMPQKFVVAASKLTNGLNLLGTALAAGFWSFAGAVVANSVVTALVAKIHPKSALLSADDASLHVRELHEKKNAKKLVTAFSQVSGVGIFTYLNPVYAPLWAATIGLKTVANLSLNGLSRSLEYQADRGAVELGANPLALISSLRKISALQERSIQKAWGEHPVPQRGALSKWWKNVNSTHPTLENRVSRLADLARRAGYAEDNIQETINKKPDVGAVQDIPYDIIRTMASRLV